MDFHVLTPAGPELLMYVVDGELIIVPAPDAQNRELDQFGKLSGAASAPPAPGT